MLTVFVEALSALAGLGDFAYWCTKRDDRRVSVPSSLRIGLDGRERERMREGKSERETKVLKLLLQNIA